MYCQENMLVKDKKLLGILCLDRFFLLHIKGEENESHCVNIKR